MNTAYKIILSNKVEISIDQDEIPAVEAAIMSKSMCKVRQGLFNPSFLVAIVEDESRLEKFYEAKEARKRHNELHPENQQPDLKGFKPLKDIFNQTKQLT